MDERRLNIEEWLLQAAARQTEERTPDAGKQQAWLQLHAMLDEEPERRSWIWIFDVVVLILVGLMLMLPGMYENMPMRHAYNGAVSDWERNAAENKEKSGGWNDKNNTNGDQKSAEGVNDGENKTEKSYDGKDVKNEEKKDDDRNAKKEEEINYGKDVKNEDKKDNDKNAKKEEEINYRKDVKNEDKKDHDKNAKKEEEINYGKDVNKRNNRKSDPEALQVTLTRLPNRQPLPARIADSLSGSNQQQITVQSSTVKIKDLPANAFSLNGAFALPAGGQYALHLAAEYNYRIWNGFLIRPRIGAAYLNAGKREYNHTAYFPSTDTVTNPANPYRVDSLVTNYTVKGILFGMAGLQVAYQYKKLEVFTGIAFHHQLILTGNDSAYTQSREITGTPPVYQHERFNKNRLPGKTNLQLQAGINYMLTRHLQAGASYNILIQKSAAQKGLDASALAIPAASSATLHVRWFFKKE